MSTTLIRHVKRSKKHPLHSMFAKSSRHGIHLVLLTLLRDDCMMVYNIMCVEVFSYVLALSLGVTKPKFLLAVNSSILSHILYVQAKLCRGQSLQN